MARGTCRLGGLRGGGRRVVRRRLDERQFQPAAASFDAGAVTAADSNSLFHTKNFGKVLGIVRSHVGAGSDV